MGTINIPDGTGAILNVATDLDGLVDEFFKEYSELTTMTEGDLAASWKGDDYIKFKTNVDNSKPKFERLRDILTEYASNLRNDAQAHENRVADSAAQVDSSVGSL